MAALIMDGESAAYWCTIRSAFFTDAEQAEPEPETVNLVDIPLDQWAEVRASKFGVVDSANADFIGLTAADSAGLPDWRTRQPEQVEITEMDQYVGERAAAGVHEAPQASAGNTRVNPSPYRIT